MATAQFRVGQRKSTKPSRRASESVKTPETHIARLRRVAAEAEGGAAVDLTGRSDEELRSLLTGKQ
jgi:hypothetical protein